MTDVWIGPPEGAAFGSTPKESSVAKTEAAPKLDSQRELDRKSMQAPIAPNEPRGARKLRVAATIVALLVVLGVGWGAGVKTHEFANVPPASTWVQDTVPFLMSKFDVLRKQMVASIESLINTSGAQQMTGPDKAPKNTAEVIEQVARGLFVKMDQVRASSETEIRELRSGIDRLNGSVERSQREVLTRLGQLQERLDRAERQSAGATTTKPAQPLDQRAAAKPVPLPLQPSALSTPTAAPKPTTTPAQVKRIEKWEVMEVVDGTAVLAGPRGIIEVSSGDVVPGAGRVQSISRRGGRWVVATSRGVITGR
jgi:hypothetical protein